MGVLDGAKRGLIGGLRGVLARLEGTPDAGSPPPLAQGEAELRAMVAQAAAGIVRTDLDGVILTANARFCQMVGREVEDLVGHSTTAFTHPDDIAETRAFVRDTPQADDERQIAKRYVKPDGTVTSALLSVRTLHDLRDEPYGLLAVAVDVTAQRAAENDLRESEERFRLMADTAPSPVWLTNEDGEVEFVNQALVVFYGYPAEQILGHVWKQAIHPDDTAAVAEAQAAARPAHQPYGFECRFQRADGVWRWMRVSVNPRFDGTGTFRGYVGLSFDVTDTREALDALRESEHRFRAVADTAPVLIWVTGADRQREFVNQAYIAYMGGDPETVRTADWRSYIHPDDQARLVTESLAGEATGQPFPLEARYLRHDGQYRWLKSFSRPRLGLDGAVIGFVGVAFDVTDIRESEARLIESESRFRTIADSAPALIWMTDTLSRITFANKRYKVFFGVEPDAVLGDGWRALVYPADLEIYSLAFLRAFDQRDRFEAVMRVQHPTLGLRWLRSEGIPRFDATGAFQGYVGASLDITEAKRAEDDLTRINELLEERVGEALAEKARAEADLMHAQRMEAVGRLTGGVAHDFNNLLTVVIGALDMILRSPDDAARRKKLGEAALAAARRGESLTHQLLAFSRRQALRPQAVDLNALIREGEPLLRRAVGEAVEFRLKLRRGGTPVSVDPAQFEAALLNLIVNARDAVAEKKGKATGRISIQTMSCSVAIGDVVDLAAGDYVCITVSDNGAGMDAATLTRVFEPFFTTKSVGKGTGLGLSQVYGFARQSGGGVQVSSTVGRGTEIRMYLPPLAVGETVAVAGNADDGEALAAGRRLLLVEDDAGVSAVAVELLEGLGLDVVAVETGPQALTALGDERFDVMLSDVVMPGGMTGIELARQAGPLHPEMRIILTSGYAGDDVDAALADAPWPFLRKPYSRDQLRDALAALLPVAR